jgi:hypothetical protein
MADLEKTVSISKTANIGSDNAEPISIESIDAGAEKSYGKSFL